MTAPQAPRRRRASTGRPGRSATRGSSRRSRRGEVLAALLATAVLAGCGEDAKQAAPSTAPAKGTRTTTTAAKPPPAPRDTTSSADKQQIAAVLAIMERAINAGDAERLCTDVYAFRGDTTRQDCIAVLGPALSQSDARTKITVSTIRGNGRRATVRSSSRQTFTLVKDDVRWRVLFDE